MFKKKNKKGVLDFFFILMLIFSIAIITIIGQMLLTEFRDQVSGDTVGYDSDTAQHALDKAATTLENLDYIFILIIAGIIIVGVASGFWIKSAPVFFFVSVMAIMIVVLLAAQFSNVFDAIRSADKLAVASDNFPIINHFMDNYPLYLLLICIIITVIVYAKHRYGEPGV